MLGPRRTTGWYVLLNGEVVVVAAEFWQGFAKRVPEKYGRSWERQWSRVKGWLPPCAYPLFIYRLGGRGGHPKSS